MQDISRHEVLHTERDLMNHCVLVAAFTLLGLEVVDNIAFVH